MHILIFFACLVFIAPVFQRKYFNCENSWSINYNSYKLFSIYGIRKKTIIVMLVLSSYGLVTVHLSCKYLPHTYPLFVQRQQECCFIVWLLLVPSRWNKMTMFFRWLLCLLIFFCYAEWLQPLHRVVTHSLSTSISVCSFLSFDSTTTCWTWDY